MTTAHGGGADIRRRAFAFAVRVARLCHSLDQRPGAPRTLSSQVLRSGTSVGANLEEAKAGQSRADFISKVAIALKEARETHYWLRLLVAAGIAPEAEIGGLVAEADELVRTLTAILVAARGRP